MGRRWLSPTNDNYSCWWTTTSIVGRQPAAPSRHPNHSASHPEADLAARFLDRYQAEPMRGYGGGMRTYMQQLALGVPYREAAGSLFGGQGSYGNGAAMRVAPLGALFHQDLAQTAHEAERSARVTHNHDEAAAGASAVALAAAIITRAANSGRKMQHPTLLREVADLTPSSLVQERLLRLLDTPETLAPREVAGQVGSGQAVSALDTVPFVIWCASRFLHDFEEALWQTVSGLGDRDTTCAMVGGLVALWCGRDGIPAAWLAAAEALPTALALSSEDPDEAQSGVESGTGSAAC
jgi:ADP-ribosylglycohydrolase